MFLLEGVGRLEDYERLIQTISLSHPLSFQTESDELESIDTTTLESEIISLKAKEVELKSSLKLLVQGKLNVFLLQSITINQETDRIGVSVIERTKLNSEPQTKDLNSTLSNIITKVRSLFSIPSPPYFITNLLFNTVPNSKTLTRNLLKFINYFSPT